MAQEQTDTAGEVRRPPLRGLWTISQAYVVLVMFFSEVLDTMGRSTLSVLQVPIKQDLMLTDAQIGLLMGGAAYIPYVLFTLPFARWSERAERPKVLGIAIFVRALATAACAFAVNIQSFFAARVVVGAADGGSQPVQVAIVADNIRAKQRGMAMSLMIMGLPIGNLLGPVLAAGLTESIGWRNAFITFAIPGMIVAALIAFTVRDQRLKDAKKATVEKARPVSGFFGDIKLLLKNKPYVLYWIGAGLLSMEISGTTLFTAAYFVRKFGMTLSEAAWLTGLGLGVTGLLGTLVGGFIADRWADSRGRSYVLVVAAACGLSGVFFMLVYTRETMMAAAVFLGLANFATALKNGPVHAAAQNMSPPHMRATTSAVGMMGVMFFATLGPLLVGNVSDLVAASTFPSAMGDFQQVCLAGPPSDAVAGACGQAGAEGLRLGLITVSFFYFVSTAFLIAAAFALRKPITD